jgi:Trypsin-like peptidase domain
MDRRQLVVQRARELFGERLEDVVHMARQDRQDLRGWEEPAHVRAVLRRTIREGGTPEPEPGEVAVSELEFGRTAGEPDRGQQREAVGQLLETGANALEKVARGYAPDLPAEERLGLECLLLLYGRPSVLVSQDRLSSVPPLWNILEDQRENIEMAQRGVGRIELLGHPEFDWAGTAFLVNETCLITTRRTLELFAENRSGPWNFRPGITAWMNYRSQYQQQANAGYRIRGVFGVLDQYDLALLEVEPPQQRNTAPMPLAVAGQAPPRLEGRPVYLIGYPVRNALRNDPETITRIFRDVYNVKRVQPGLLRGTLPFGALQFLQTDCAPLGQTSGSPIVDLETHQVLGLQLTSRYLEPGTAVPLWVLRDEPLFRRAGVTFAEATAEDLQSTTNQIERLARSRYWSEVRATIASMYQRAFGNTGNFPGNGR